METKIIIDLKNIEIMLPDEKIIVDKDEYVQLRNEDIRGKYLTLQEVATRLSVSRDWLLNHVLFNPKIRNEIDIDKNPNGFVKYPESKGQKYLFLATKTISYFEENFLTLLTQ